MTKEEFQSLVSSYRSACYEWKDRLHNVTADPNTVEEFKKSTQLLYQLEQKILDAYNTAGPSAL